MHGRCLCWPAESICTLKANFDVAEVGLEAIIETSYVARMATLRVGHLPMAPCPVLETSCLACWWHAVGVSASISITTPPGLLIVRAYAWQILIHLLKILE